MRISNSKKQLAKIISENGGWRDAAGWAVQHRNGRVVTTAPDDKPYFEVGDEWWSSRWFFVGFDWALLSNWHQTILSRDEYFHLYPAPDADGWIEWKSQFYGDMPCGEDAVVDVLCGTCTHSGYIAENFKHWGSVTAYRLHKQEVEVAAHGDSTLTISGDPMTAMRRIQDSLVFDTEPTIEQLAADYRTKLAIAQQAQEEADSHRCGAAAALDKLVAAGKALGLVLSVAAPELVITDWRDLQVGDCVECVQTPFGANCKPGMSGVVTETTTDGVRARFDASLSGRADGSWYSTQGACYKFIRRPAKGGANA